MTAKWEVFDPKNGEPVLRVRWAWLACVIAWITGDDYAREGDGWI